jgi:hypothetical protein
VATSVLPSPVRISAIFPWCSAMPPPSARRSAHAEHAARGLAHHREGFGQDRVELLACGNALLQLRGLRLQLGVGELLERGLERVDGDDRPAEFLEKAVVAAAEDGLESVGEHGGIEAG